MGYLADPRETLLEAVQKVDNQTHVNWLLNYVDEKTKFEAFQLAIHIPNNKNNLKAFYKQDRQCINRFLMYELQQEKFENIGKYLHIIKEINIVLFKEGLDAMLEAAKKEPQKVQGRIMEVLLKEKLLSLLHSSEKKSLLEYFEKNNLNGKNNKNIKCLNIVLDNEQKLNLAKQNALAQLENLRVHNENESRAFGFIGRLILPAQTTYKSKAENRRLRNYVIEHIQDNDNINIVFKPYRIETQDKEAVLDALEIVNTSVSQKNRKYVINFGGNNQAYEYGISSMIAESARLKCNVIGFNYRGVAQSKGNPSSKQRLREDGITQVQRLLDQGIDPSKITLKGHSLGGSVAASVAKYFSDKKPSIKLFVFSDRTFSTLTKAIVGFIKNYFEQKNWPRLGKALAFLASGIVKPIVMFAGFDMNTAEDYRAIDENHKEYLVVKATKKMKSSGTDDKLIHPDASLHTELKPERKLLKQQIIDKLGENAKYMIKYNKMSAPLVGDIGHNIGLSDLRNESGMTGIEIFDHFFTSQGKVSNKIERMQLLHQKIKLSEPQILADASPLNSASQPNITNKQFEFSERNREKPIIFARQHKLSKGKNAEKPIVSQTRPIKPGKKE